MFQKTTATILIFSENSDLVSEIRDFLAEAQYDSVEWPHHSPIKDIMPIESRIEAIIFDLPEDGDEITYLVHILKTQASLIPFIAIVDAGDIKNAVRIMQEGASTAITKPVDKQAVLLALNDIGSQPANLFQPQSIIRQAIELLQSLNTGSMPAGTNAPAYETPPIPNAHQEVLKLADLTIDMIRQKAFYRDAPIDLTTSQFRILSCLAKSHRRIVPYEDLYFYLHNIQLDSASARTALSAHLSYLRAKLSEVGCEEYLVNIRGRGYVLDIPIETKIQASEIDIDLVLQQLPIAIWTTNTELHVTSSLGAPIFPLDNNKIQGSHLSNFLQLDGHEHTILLAHQQALVGQKSRYEQWLGNRLLHICILPYMNRNNQIIGSLGLAVHITNAITND